MAGITDPADPLDRALAIMEHALELADRDHDTAAANLMTAAVFAAYLRRVPIDEILATVRECYAKYEGGFQLDELEKKVQVH